MYGRSLKFYTCIVYDCQHCLSLWSFYICQSEGYLIFIIFLKTQSSFAAPTQQSISVKIGELDNPPPRWGHIHWYRVTAHCMVTYFEVKLPCLSINLYLRLFYLAKWFISRSYSQNTSILGIFGSKYGHLTPCGDYIEKYSLLFGDSFWRNTKCFVVNAIMLLLYIIECLKCWSH